MKVTAWILYFPPHTVLSITTATFVTWLVTFITMPLMAQIVVGFSRFGIVPELLSKVFVAVAVCTSFWASEFVGRVHSEGLPE